MMTFSEPLKLLDQRLSRLFAWLWPVPDYVVKIGFIQILGLLCLGNLPIKLAGYFYSEKKYQKLKLLRSFVHDPWESQNSKGLEILWKASASNRTTTIAVKTADEALMIAGLINRLVGPCRIATSPTWKPLATALWEHIARINGLNFEDHLRGDQTTANSHYRFHLRLHKDLAAQAELNNTTINASATISLTGKDEYRFIAGT